MRLKNQMKDRAHDAERAWDQLSSAMEKTSKRTRKMADGASTKVTATSDEARRRASAAMDALAGRKPRRPWNLLAGALAIGAALGMLVNAMARRAARMMDRRPADDLLGVTPADLGEHTTPAGLGQHQAPPTSMNTGSTRATSTHTP